MRSDRLNISSGKYNEEHPGNDVFRWNYISCGMPIVSNLGHSADGVMATEDKFGMIFPGPQQQWYPASCLSIGAYTAVGKTPQVDGSVPATDTATTSAGLDIQMDCETAADTGLEVVLGGGPLGGFNGFTIGTHTGYIDATFITPDWTDFEGVGIGFRKVQDFNDGHVPILKAGSAADGVYTDFAAQGAMGNTNIQTMTDLNNSGTSTVTNANIIPVDGQNMQLRITISSSGAVTYAHAINGVAGAEIGHLTTIGSGTEYAAFSFDDGDEVIPYLYTSADTAAADVLYLKDVTVRKYPSTAAFNTQK